MNVADNGIVAAKIKNANFTVEKCTALTAGLFVFGKIGAQEQHVVHMQSLVPDLSLEQGMLADEKAHSGSMLAGGIVSRNL